MTDQYRHVDRPDAPQAVQVNWRKVIVTDLLQPESFRDFRDNYDNGGTRKRWKAFERGDWEYVGVRASVTVSVPIGGGAFTIYTLDSAGIYGVESDAGEYLDELYQEQREELAEHLQQIGAAFA